MGFGVFAVTAELFFHRSEDATRRVLQTFAVRVVAEVGEQLPDTLLGFLIGQLVTHGR